MKYTFKHKLKKTLFCFSSNTRIILSNLEIAISSVAKTMMGRHEYKSVCRSVLLNSIVTLAKEVIWHLAFVFDCEQNNGYTQIWKAFSQNADIGPRLHYYILVMFLIPQALQNQ